MEFLGQVCVNINTNKEHAPEVLGDMLVHQRFRTREVWLSNPDLQRAPKYLTIPMRSCELTQHTEVASPDKCIAVGHHVPPLTSQVEQGSK